MYRYFRGMHPPGSDQVDYARSRIYDTASHVKDYASQYGGYLQIKVKDAAPGAWEALNEPDRFWVNRVFSFSCLDFFFFF